MKKIKILQIVPSLGLANGVAAYLNNYYENMDLSKFETTILVLNNDDKERYFVPEVNSSEEDLQSIVIDLIDNGFKCSSCSKQDTGSISMSDPTKNAIKYIMSADPKKIFSFELSENCQKELELIANIYLNEKLEKEYKLEKLF